MPTDKCVPGVIVPTNTCVPGVELGLSATQAVGLSLASCCLDRSRRVRGNMKIVSMLDVQGCPGGLPSGHPQAGRRLALSSPEGSSLSLAGSLSINSVVSPMFGPLKHLQTVSSDKVSLKFLPWMRCSTRTRWFRAGLQFPWVISPVWTEAKSLHA